MSNLRPERPDLRPERPDLRPEGSEGGGDEQRNGQRNGRMDEWTNERTNERTNKQTDERTNKSPPVFYRTSSPLGPLPKKQPNLSNIMRELESFRRKVDKTKTKMTMEIISSVT